MLRRCPTESGGALQMIQRLGPVLRLQRTPPGEPREQRRRLAVAACSGVHQTGVALLRRGRRPEAEQQPLAEHAQGTVVALLRLRPQRLDRDRLHGAVRGSPHSKALR